MRVNKWTWGLATAGLVSLPTLVAQAEEKPSPILTALSSTTISGYVNTSLNWKFGTGNAGAILTSGDFLMFSTNTTGDQLYAKTKNGSAQISTGLGAASLGSHRFRIEWSTTEVKYYVDVLDKVRQTPEWKKFMEDGAFSNTTMIGKEYADWVAKNETLHYNLMKEAGFLAAGK